jgi:hypothetical protein
MKNIMLLACFLAELVQPGYRGRRVVIGALGELSHYEFIKRAGCRLVQNVRLEACVSGQE